MTIHKDYEWRIGNKRSNRNGSDSNREKIEKLSVTDFVTNFPNDLVENDLWHLFEEFGKIADVYIARKLSKNGRKFAFVIYLNVFDGDRLEKRLAYIWVGNFHLFVSVAKFKRGLYDSSRNKGTREREDQNQQKGNSISHGLKVIHGNSYANVLKRNEGEKTKLIEKVMKKIIIHVSDLHVVDDSRKVTLGRIKDASVIPTLYHLCLAEGFDDVQIKYAGGTWSWFEFHSEKTCIQFKQTSGISSFFFVEFSNVTKNFVVKEYAKWIEINGLPISAWSVVDFKKVANVFGRVLERPSLSYF